MDSWYHIAVVWYTHGRDRALRFRWLWPGDLLHVRGRKAATTGQKYNSNHMLEGVVAFLVVNDDLKRRSSAGEME